MATAMLDGLEITTAEAKKVLKIAKKFGAFSDDIPTDKKELLEAAHKTIAFCIDAWISDGMKPTAKDPELKESGEQIAQIFEAAGVEIDKKNNVTFASQEDEDEDDDDDDVDEDDTDDEDDDDEEDDDEDEDDDDEDDEEEDDDDDEAPFDPDDYIEGYTELSAASKVKALKKLDLEDEDTVAVIEQIKDWEEAQDKPTSRVLAWIEETFEDDDEESDDEDDEDADDADESDDDDGDDDEEEEESDEDESDEPWPGYDKQTAVEVKKVLDDEMEEGNLQAEHITYVKEYEEAKERPRKRILTHLAALAEQLEGGDDEEEEDDKPAPKKRTGKKTRGKQAADPDDSDEVDEAVAADDEKESRKAKKGYITLTRDQILEALDQGEVTVKVG